MQATYFVLHYQSYCYCTRATTTVLRYDVNHCTDRASVPLSLVLGYLPMEVQVGEQAWRKCDQNCKQPISSSFTNRNRPRSIFSILCPCSWPAVPQVIFYFSEQVELLVAGIVTAGWVVHLVLQVSKLGIFY